jgi:hypothetical protein
MSRCANAKIDHSKCAAQGDANGSWKILIAGRGHEVNDFLKISSLIEPRISAFSHFTTSEPFGYGLLCGRGTSPLGSQLFYSNMVGRTSISELNQSHVNEIIDALKQYKHLDAINHEGIIRAVDLHQTTRHLNPTSSWIVLAYFSIIEMLLTHNPRDKEIGDSITHQLRTKIALLSERLTKPFDYTLFGSQVNPDKIWKDLYSYRSSIAHGEHIDFNIKFKTLKNEITALGFLASATRNLLIYSFTEPNLINRLKPI